LADYTKTITNTVRVWGPEPTEKWSSATVGSVRMIWGTDKWAYGTVGLETLFGKAITAGTVTILGRSEINVGKWVSGSITPTSTVGFAVQKAIPNTLTVTTTVGKMASVYTTNTVANTSTIANLFQKFYDNSVLIDSVFSNTLSGIRETYNTLSLSSGVAVYLTRQGYSIEVGGISNAVNWPRSTGFTKQSPRTTTWTEPTATSTVWV